MPAERRTGHELFSAVLGETAFQAAYHHGLKLPAEDAFAYALQQPPDKPPDKPTAPPPAAPEPGAAPLTLRELQVTRLVARGCNNKEIAAQLMVSQRTPKATWSTSAPSSASPREPR